MCIARLLQYIHVGRPIFRIVHIIVKKRNARTQDLIALFSPKLVWVLLQNSKKQHESIYTLTTTTIKGDRYVIAAAVECPKMDSSFSAKCNLLFYIFWLVPVDRIWCIRKAFCTSTRNVKFENLFGLMYVCIFRWLLNIYSHIQYDEYRFFSFFVMPFVEKCTEIKRKPMNAKNDFEFRMRYIACAQILILNFVCVLF